MEGESDAVSGLRFGRFRAIREIGRGATSCVYLAEDDGGVAQDDAFGAQEWAANTVKGRRVAIKVVDFTDDRSKLSRRFRKLFATEAAVTAQFDHPNIAKVHDWRVEEHRAYLVMELVEGQGLDQFVTMDKLLPMHRVVGIIFKVAMALDYAHRRGIVHRDIKPANVMLTKDDEVKLMDFGLALNIRKNVNVDSTFINGLGSPSYMSPEQIKGYTLNHQTDLYSLGVMFYQLLTGRLPFRAPNTAALVYKIINTEAVPVTQLNPDLPELTNKVIQRALEKDLYSRYRLGADMAKDLSAVRFQILQENQVLPDETKWKAVRSLPILAKLDDTDVWELLRISAWRVLPPATVIMKDGDAGKSFGFIIDGDVEVEKGDRALAKLSRGDIVGEVAFLQSEGGTRTASVTTLNQVTFLEINPAAFAFATEELATEIRRVAVDAMIERMRAANRLAKHFSPVAVHPTPVPEGESQADAGAAAAYEAPGWSVFSKPALLDAVSAPLAQPAAPVPPPAADPIVVAAPAVVVPPEVPEPPVPLLPDLPAPGRSAAPAAPTTRSSTVVVQPLPAAAAAAIAQMAMTQHPRAGQTAQPFELGPEATAEMSPTPVSELPPDAVLTTDLGASFDEMPHFATTEVRGGLDASPRGVLTTELAPKYDAPPVATAEMAADFGRPPEYEATTEVAPEFDVHAPPTGVMPTYAATTEMAAQFASPSPARGSAPAPVPGARSVLMPATRPVADQSTQELAGHFLQMPAGQDDRTLELPRGFQPGVDDGLDALGSDMFPPIELTAETARPADAPAAGATRGHEAPLPQLLVDDEESHEATVAINLPAMPAAPLDDEPYEATQVLGSTNFAAPLPSLEPAFDAAESGGAFALPRPRTALDGQTPPKPAPPEDFDRTVELAGGFVGAPDDALPEEEDLFPPLKL